MAQSYSVRPSDRHGRPQFKGPVVLIEFNELSPSLMDRFINAGSLPNFKAFRDRAQAYTSDAEEAAPNLEPWIQWVTVHSGMPYDKHGIFHLGDGHKLDVDSVADLASKVGLTVWVCGSMNIKVTSPVKGVVVPDPWSAGTRPFPPELAPYHDFVRKNVQEHTKDKAGISAREALAFGKFMLTHGLSLGTMLSIVTQLASERVTRRGRWKRVAILDRLQKDLFLHYLRKNKPKFSSFFLNSTAHLQHMHWRNMDPEPFTVKPSEREQEEFQDAIHFGYAEMDRVLGDIVAAAPADAYLILATALSQQPCLIYEETGGKTFYRPRTIESLLRFAGIAAWTSVEPIMSEQFHVRFGSDQEARDAGDKLSALSVDGRTALGITVEGRSLTAGCRIFDTFASHEVMLQSSRGGACVPFFRIFYHVEGTKSGMHHPDGILWIKAPEGNPLRGARRVSLLDVAPTMLDILGIEQPAYMPGHSLLQSAAGESQAAEAQPAMAEAAQSA